MLDRRDTTIHFIGGPSLATREGEGEGEGGKRFFNPQGISLTLLSLINCPDAVDLVKRIVYESIQKICAVLNQEKK